MEFRSPLGAIIFLSVFTVMGTAVSGVVSYEIINSEKPGTPYGEIVTMCLGALFVFLGFFGLFYENSPIIFDKTEGMSWKARKSPRILRGKNPFPDIPLNTIHALQLISCFVEGGSDSDSYFNYQLILVLKNAQRVFLLNRVETRATFVMRHAYLQSF